MIPPALAVIQARMGSTRLPRKMLADLGGKPLVLWTVEPAVKEFGAANTVAAIPASEENDELAAVLAPYVNVFRWDGPERDVLGRFHACATTFRWAPWSVIMRLTADDPFKDTASMRRVSLGERLPVEMGGEAFTLAQLREAHATATEREHLTHVFFDSPPPSPPSGIWTVDTAVDLDRARRRVTAMRLTDALA